MKNEKRYRFKPLPCFILIEVILVLILLLCGFRITYSPSLENSWNAISAVASWASVFVSGLAIYYAIQVPKRIAEGQNRITLYEKRYAVYSKLSDCFTYAYLLENLNHDGKNWGFFLGIAFSDDEITEANPTHIKSNAIFQRVYSTLKQSEFLFTKEVADEIINLSGKLLLLIEAESRGKDILTAQKEFIEQASKVEKNKEKIVEQLRLS